MLAIVENMATLLQTLYNNIQYLIEHDSSSLQLNASIPTDSTTTTAAHSLHQLDINDEDVLISFVTTTLIWFIVAIIIILSASIVSLIITNISFRDDPFIIDSDLEKQPLSDKS
ncbi:hypothetical protein MOSE0_K09208 [Monosporozyma servazzii]